MSFDVRSFLPRHLGPSAKEQKEMLSSIGCISLEDLIDQTIPDQIRNSDTLNLPEPLSEFEYLTNLKTIAEKNQVFKSLIGQGYYDAITPSPILRNIFQNPGWYTQYTPYQAEISQGRLEALLNFQTMVSDLTGMPLANASLLDEGTAAAEAMLMFYSLKNKRIKENPANKIWVDPGVFQTTLDVLASRAIPKNIEIIQDQKQDLDDQTFAILIQYPGKDGGIKDFQQMIAQAKVKGIYIIVAADLLSLALLAPPGEWGADVVVGNTQRFGIPMGFGGPHAAYFATLEAYKRIIPGRIIGVSIDVHGNRALRMALQTREQHIKREKATSNICTAQALLAIMAGMYGVYHGPHGLKQIAGKIHRLTSSLANRLQQAGFSLKSDQFFDTISLLVSKDEQRSIQDKAISAGYNFFYPDEGVSISLDETCDQQVVAQILNIFGVNSSNSDLDEKLMLNPVYLRKSTFMTHPVFNTFHTETKLMRYIKRLENKDLSLVHGMIPLGSCTMKLNAATQLIPVSWEEFARLHPFAPINQVQGYRRIFKELESYLCEITGFTACSLQPNSGAQGEFAGLMVIRAYHRHHNQDQRNIAIIPQSAHGTNPASAIMAGMKVVVVKCDDMGNIDLPDLKAKCREHQDSLGALMVTYPSTHGVFETSIVDVCNTVHDAGGLVYMDGANMNAQVGLTSPARIGADVCHLNLHKTFAIPHGGGGPGMGPICVNDLLKPFLPTHHFHRVGGEQGIPSVASAPWGSASILLISYAYICMLGSEGATLSSKIAILNANYIKSRLENDYSILYVGENGRVAHELIVDIRPFKHLGIQAEDVAKRLMDYGFHSPTLSFPVAGTLMVEPTESEDKEELDRFCEAMIRIKAEIDEIETGTSDPENNVLTNAPHTAEVVTSDHWEYPYGRQKAAYPVPNLRNVFKFWPSVGRVNNGYGDRNLMCTCPPLEAYVED